MILRLSLPEGTAASQPQKFWDRRLSMHKHKCVIFLELPLYCQSVFATSPYYSEVSKCFQAAPRNIGIPATSPAEICRHFKEAGLHSKQNSPRTNCCKNTADPVAYWKQIDAKVKKNICIYTYIYMQNGYYYFFSAF